MNCPLRLHVLQPNPLEQPVKELLDKISNPEARLREIDDMATIVIKKASTDEVEGSTGQVEASPGRINVSNIDKLHPKKYRSMRAGHARTLFPTVTAALSRLTTAVISEARKRRANQVEEIISSLRPSFLVCSPLDGEGEVLRDQLSRTWRAAVSLRQPCLACLPTEMLLAYLEQQCWLHGAMWYVGAISKGELAENKRVAFLGNEIGTEP